MAQGASRRWLRVICKYPGGGDEQPGLGGHGHRTSPLEKEEEEDKKEEEQEAKEEKEEEERAGDVGVARAHLSGESP